MLIDYKMFWYAHILIELLNITNNLMFLSRNKTLVKFMLYAFIAFSEV